MLYALAFLAAAVVVLRASRLPWPARVAPGWPARLLRYGLAQQRVVRRPRGVAHAVFLAAGAVLFAGTCLRAAEHWTGAQVRGPAFETAMNVAGVAFLGGVLAALALKPSRALVALLAVGLTGFAAQALRGDPTAWWVHALLALGTLAAVPVHVLAAPLAVVAGTGRPLPEADPPFDLRDLLARGAFEAPDRPADLRLAQAACTDCGRCEDACDPGISHRLLHGTHGDEDVWGCTTCAACVTACPVLNRPVEAVLPLRRAAASGQRLPERAVQVLGNLSRSGNPYGLDARDRRAQPGPADLLYWVGCAGSYDPRVQAVVKATVRVLEAGGLRVWTLGPDEACCGDPARRLGEEGLFQQLCLQNLDTLSRHQVRRIVTHCAHCYHVLQHEYRRFGAEFAVLHHSELLASLNLALKPRTRTVAYRDSCHLGRYHGLTDAPRRALARVAQVEDLPDASCCGAGGGRYWFADVPQRADNVAVACPYCLRTVGGKDVAEYLAEALA